MCGVFGWVLSGGQGQSRETLARLTDLMSHRGPDGAGYWLSEGTNSGHQIALGHRRLSIIDIGGGAQPMWSADGAIAVVFNGEIYNYLELRDELALRGHRFRSQSDTEVLIESYRAWGLDAVRRFRGMFAFALWDGANERLVLARDAFGKKPLFLAERSGGGLLFASEIEPIVRFPGFDRDFDPDALGHYLLNRYVPGPLTFFRNVKKLQPGHYCVWQDGSLATERYFVAPLRDRRARHRPLRGGGRTVHADVRRGGSPAHAQRRAVRRLSVWWHRLLGGGRRHGAAQPPSDPHVLGRISRAGLFRA